MGATLGRCPFYTASFTSPSVSELLLFATKKLRISSICSGVTLFRRFFDFLRFSFSSVLLGPCKLSLRSWRNTHWGPTSLQYSSGTTSWFSTDISTAFGRLASLLHREYHQDCHSAPRTSSLHLFHDIGPLLDLPASRSRARHFSLILPLDFLKLSLGLSIEGRLSALESTHYICFDVFTALHPKPFGLLLLTMAPTLSSYPARFGWWIHPIQIFFTILDSWHWLWPHQRCRWVSLEWRWSHPPCFPFVDRRLQIVGTHYCHPFWRFCVKEVCEH